ncbi:hypothetical protein L6452_42361 [Arctium lappa]|uniref:Uncharacterized protein n=1 Tax=Arctium lappa TaxID=4217 RepID=A0ACB8XIT1_ARCLA|nr:hypothetical protein L6452_42361 [Arctium lappa]
MAETNGGSTTPSPPPSRRINHGENLFNGGPEPGFSLGPVTLVSNFFSDHYHDVDWRSFSQLLVDAMASRSSQIPSTYVLEDSSYSEQVDSKKKLGGVKQNPGAMN